MASELDANRRKANPKESGKNPTLHSRRTTFTILNMKALRVLFTSFAAPLLRPSVTTSWTRTMATTTTSLPDFGSPNFGITKKLSGHTFDATVEKVQEELKKVGFGVLTQIDMKATMEKKIATTLDRPYVILGACNPKLAHQALQTMPGVGLLLPCNIIVTEDKDGDVVVSALQPLTLFGVVDSSEHDMAPLANEVQALMQTVMDSL